MSAVHPLAGHSDFGFFVTGPYGLEISKRYSSYSLSDLNQTTPPTGYPISTKLLEDIGYCGKIQVVTCLGNHVSLKFWEHFFEISVSVSIGKILKYWLSFKNLWYLESLAWASMENHKMLDIKKGLIVEWNGWKFGIWGLIDCICTILFMADYLRSSCWGRSVLCTKFPMLRFSKCHFFQSFIRFKPIFVQRMVIR